MDEKTLTCYHCEAAIKYTNTHAASADQVFFYCNKCGIVTTLDRYSKEMEEGKFYDKFLKSKSYDLNDDFYMGQFWLDMKKMRREIEIHLAPCSCSGKFTADAVPRCPACKEELEWDKVADNLEKTTGRTMPHYFRRFIRKGWHDMYYFVFDLQIVRNNWLRAEDREDIY